MAEKSILLVEDDPDDEVLIMRELRRNNIANHIAVVRDGAEALDYLFCKRAFGDRDPLDLPTVVILDLKLPKIDGLEVLRQIRGHKITKLLPVVIMTSSDAERDIAASYNHGANSYVRKPVNFDEFSQAVRQLHIYWLLTNEPPPKPDRDHG